MWGPDVALLEGDLLLFRRRALRQGGVVSDLFVGGFFVPRTHRDALFVARCALWDVANEFLYLTAENEGTAKRVGPAFVIEDEPALGAAKDDALRGLDRELLLRFASLAGT